MNTLEVDREPGTDFQGVSVAILPFPALGDITIYLRLAWVMRAAGANVKFFSDAFYSAREYFPWLDFRSEGEALSAVAARFDLVIASFEKYCDQKVEAELTNKGGLLNVAFVTAKKIPSGSAVRGREVLIHGRRFVGASRAFCGDSDAGLTMVDWVNAYAKNVFGIEAEAEGELIRKPEGGRSGPFVLIFPTTPQRKKNYWMAGFKLLARAIRKKGWHVEFVVMPSERPKLEAALSGFKVNSFADIKGLIDYVATASTVISNDSGGGHLASLMGLRTFTITRRRKHFTWRPGFNCQNTVLYPLFRFKVLGRYVWRPFVPVWLIVNRLGDCSGAVSGSGMSVGRKDIGRC
ncbi:glycosyltransferase family 9 protein [Stutzerimonas stutzeri]|uniref:glycosyltransferase family 9 protein n=1 Tax=Stutzerimonas stutzeri TaxID=316 RepID=UPI0009EA7B8D|nr:glycosyltransferase family 9 protein [Stutzerimonas stutzeri]